MARRSEKENDPGFNNSNNNKANQPDNAATNRAAMAVERFSKAAIAATEATLQLTAGFTGLWKPLAALRVAFGSLFGNGMSLSGALTIVSAKIRSSLIGFSDLLKTASKSGLFGKTVSSGLRAASRRVRVASSPAASAATAFISGSLAALTALLSFVHTIVNAIIPIDLLSAAMTQLTLAIGPIVSTLAPIINSALAMFVNILTNVIKTMEPILKLWEQYLAAALLPLLDSFGKLLVELMLLLTPVFKLVIYFMMGLSVILSVLTRVITFLIRGIRLLINTLTFGILGGGDDKEKDDKEKDDRPLEERMKEASKEMESSQFWTEFWAGAAVVWEDLKFAVKGLFGKETSPQERDKRFQEVWAESIKDSSAFQNFKTLRSQTREAEFSLFRKLGGSKISGDVVNVWKEAQTKMFDMSPAEREQIKLQQETVQLMKFQVAQWEQYFVNKLGRKEVELLLK